MFSWLRGGNAGEEGGQKAWVAKTGTPLKRYYNKELKCWVLPGTSAYYYIYY